MLYEVITGKINEEFVIILNIDKILSENELSQVAATGTIAEE